jgi:tetratricopeptide (TPR) repeat protein
LVPQLIALVVAIVVATQFSPDHGVVFGAVGFLAYSILSRRVFTRHHREGVSLVKRQEFLQAVPRFQQSLEYLDRHSWIDRFRSVVLMSASAISYREMALANIGFCYSQVGDGRRARESYEFCLERYPDSTMATAALRLMDAGSASKL